MKRFFTLFTTVVVSLSAHAQVGYVIPYTSDVAYSDELNVYSYIPQENSTAGEESPERKAYEWFRDTYSNAAGKQYFTVKDVKDGKLLSGGVPTIKALWVNVDRVGYELSSFEALYQDATFLDSLRAYVKAGGNLYLSKQATRLVTGIGRCSWWPNDYKKDGYAHITNNDRWYVTNKFTGYDHTDHAIFSGGVVYDNDYRFPMTWGKENDYYRTDNNCGWGDWNIYASGVGESDTEDGKNKRITMFELAQDCQILGGFGHTQNMQYAGLIEFFPKEVGGHDFKGTVIVMGLAAYQWGTSNTDVNNVKLLTQGILDYLSARPDVTWGDAPTTGTIAPGIAVTITPVLNDASAGKATVTHYVTSSFDIVDYHDTGSGEPGAVYYNYFGTATLSAKVQGDGVHFPKNEITAATTHSITINGGTAAEPRFAYVLPYPFNIIAEPNYDGENGKMPDFETASWFYQQFIHDGISYKDVTRYGCFIRPSDLASLPSSVKVLWIHNDHNGQTSESYYNDLGGGSFVTALKNFVANGGNVFVSKQATRLIGDLGRNAYPNYPNTGYDNRGPWRIGNHWNLTSTEIDHSTHAVYAGLVEDFEGSTFIMNAGRHTNNNHIWENWGDLPGATDPYRLTGYQDAHNCRILGAWGHYNENNPVSGQLECVGFVEYYPQENVTLHMGGDPYNQVGTIMAMGLAAYHWATPTNEIKTLTHDILYYMNIDEVPAFDWIVAPVDGEIESEQIVQVEYKAADIRWESSNSDVVEIQVDTDHPTDPDYKKLVLKSLGEATITATRYANGYQIPKNVVPATYSISRTIQVTPHVVVVTEPDTDIPSTVDDLVVYQGGSVSNPGDITINNSITYVRPAVGGTAGNELGHWYTFCLPFNPSAVKVHDEDDGSDYDINSVYLNSSVGETSDNPQGSGHFYLQTFVTYNDIDNAQWSYIRNSGMPTKDTPYIIKFIDAEEDKTKQSGLASYFTTNPVIKFIGGAQEISGNEDGTSGLATGDFSFHVNKTLRKLTLSGIYPLNTKTNMFEYDYGGTSTIMPFECYIKASSPSVANACPRIMLGRRTPEQNNTATPIENLTAENTSPVLVYDLMGRLCYETLPASLPQGMWIIRQGQTTRTIVIP